jgi:ankyrin repeat protein
LLREGGSTIREADNDGCTALICAVESGQLETVIWLLRESGSTIRETANDGCTVLLAIFGELATAQYLLEHGGADIGDTDSDGDTIWTILAEHFVESERDPEDEHDDKYNATAVTSLLGHGAARPK